MKKRFTDCDRFDDPWFRKMPLAYKALWEFITAKCDNAGVWKVDFELAAFMVGDGSIDEETALKVFNSCKQRVHAFKKGYWHIIGFVDFQFGGKDGDNNFHKQIRSLLKSHGLNNFQGQTSPSLGALDKEEDKDKEGKGVVGEKPENRIGESHFEELWLKYPKPVGKKHAKRHFLATVKTHQDYARISKHLENYKASEGVQKGFVQNGSTWFNQWEDWSFREEKKYASNSERLIAKIKG